MGTHTFIRVHVVTVNATPGDGFSHWEGDVGEESIYAPMMVIELDTSKSLTAVFKPMYTLTMAKAGGGGVSPGVGSHQYRQGTVVSLTATGGTAWFFTGWSGAVTGTLPLASVTMDANKSVTANFIAGVNITVSKQGQGTVTPESGVYPKDVPKTFIATPAEGRRSAIGGLALESLGRHPRGQFDGYLADAPHDHGGEYQGHFHRAGHLDHYKEPHRQPAR